MLDFPGKHLMADVGVIWKIVKRDPAVLANVPQEQPWSLLLPECTRKSRNRGASPSNSMRKVIIASDSEDSDDGDETGTGVYGSTDDSCDFEINGKTPVSASDEIPNVEC